MMNKIKRYLSSESSEVTITGILTHLVSSVFILGLMLFILRFI